MMVDGTVARTTADDVSAQPRRTGASVQLVGLEKRFGEVLAVDEVNLTIEPGEFLTMLGPSGSGKTTTLMMIAGFEIPTDGEIYIDDQPVVAVPPYRRNIGMVFQNYALFPHMTVAENIGFPLKQRKVDRATIARQVAEVLEVVKLPGYEARYPRQLSGGQQQRIALARAIVFNPRVLLMDEPLGALDKHLREGLQIEIRRLHAELGITFIYVTHDQSEALVMSDRIAVMNNGRVEQVGTPDELYDRPFNRFVASFIGESNFLTGAVVGAEAGLVTVTVGGRRVRAVGRDDLAPGTEAVLAVRPEKLDFRVDSLASGDGELNRLSGTVREATFVGDARRYLLDTDVGVPLTVKQQQRFGVPAHVPGDRVEVEWHVQDTLLVSRGEGAAA